MFHLINGTYLEYEENFNYQEDCIYISKFDNYKYNKNIAKMLTGEFGEDIPIMYRYARNIKELIDSFDSEAKFFDFMVDHKGYQDNKKLYIYCTPEVFRTFVIRWWKTILPNITEDAAYHLFMLYKHRSVFAHREYNLIKNNSVELHEKYWNISREVFSKLYGECTSFKARSNVKDHASLEFHLISHYCGNTTSIFKRKIRHFFKKELLDELCECKLDIERRLFFLPKILGLSETVDFNNLNIEELKTKDKRLSFIGDKNIKPKMISFEYIEKNYNLLELIRSVLDINSYLTSYFDGGPGLDPGSTFALQLYSHANGFPTTEDILDLEDTKNILGITGATAMDLYFISIFFKMANHNKMNLFLLQEIFYLKSIGKESELKPFCL